MALGSICHFLSTCLFPQEVFLGASLSSGLLSLPNCCMCASSWL